MHKSPCSFTNLLLPISFFFFSALYNPPEKRAVLIKRTKMKKSVEQCNKWNSLLSWQRDSRCLRNAVIRAAIYWRGTHKERRFIRFICLTPGVQQHEQQRRPRTTWLFAIWFAPHSTTLAYHAVATFYVAPNRRRPLSLSLSLLLTSPSSTELFSLCWIYDIHSCCDVTVTRGVTASFFTWPKLSWFFVR